MLPSQPANPSKPGATKGAEQLAAAVVEHDDGDHETDEEDAKVLTIDVFDCVHCDFGKVGLLGETLD